MDKIIVGAVEGYFSDEPPPMRPPLPPATPPAPMVGSINTQQADALVYLGLVLSIALPVSMVVRAAEERVEGAPLEYALVPAWLLLAYAFSAAAFGTLFTDMTASSLSATHFGLAALASLCALRHSQRVCESPRRPCSALMLALAIAYGVVFAFRISMRLDRCEQTLLVLSLFAGAPAYRVYARHRAEPSVDARVKSARRRQHALMLVILALVTAQPWLGVCTPVRKWAETAQLVSELTVLALATDGLW